MSLTHSWLGATGLGHLDQVGVAVEAVVRVGRFRVAALRGNQEPMLAKQSEQGIAPAGHTLGPQQRGDFVPQLAGAQTGQFAAHSPHLHQHGLGPLGRGHLALAALVEALPAYAVKLAAALHA